MLGNGVHRLDSTRCRRCGLGRLRIGAPMGQIARTLEKQLHAFRAALENFSLRTRADPTAPDGGGLFEKLLPDPDRIWGGARNAFSAAFGIVGSAIAIALIGIFAAADPYIYRRGIIALMPADERRRVGDVLDEVGEVLRWWLIGQLVTMAIISVTVAFALTLLGIPGALLLGLQAALLNFIPYLGPFLAAVPILLAAIPLGISMIVGNGNLFRHPVEGYALMPIIQKQAINLPPVLTLVSIMLFGALFGGAGIAMATPIVAAIRVAMLRLYVEDETDRVERGTA